MKTYFQTTFAPLVLFTTFFAIPALAWSPGQPIVPNCLGTSCGWQDLVILADNILSFFLYIAVPIAAIAFAWAGWLYLSARGNMTQIQSAHSIFLNVFIGLIIVLSAWLIVDLIFEELVDPNTYLPVLTS